MDLSKQIGLDKLSPQNRKIAIGVGVAVVVGLGWYLFVRKPAAMTSTAATTLKPGTTPPAGGGSAPAPVAVARTFAYAAPVMTGPPPAPTIDYQAQKAYDVLGQLITLADSDTVMRYPSLGAFKGQLTPVLQAAISKYQAAHGLPVTGSPDQTTIDNMSAYYDKMSGLLATDPYLSPASVNLG